MTNFFHSLINNTQNRTLASAKHVFTSLIKQTMSQKPTNLDLGDTDLDTEDTDSDIAGNDPPFKSSRDETVSFSVPNVAAHEVSSTLQGLHSNGLHAKDIKRMAAASLSKLTVELYLERQRSVGLQSKLMAEQENHAAELAALKAKYRQKLQQDVCTKELLRNERGMLRKECARSSFVR